MIDPTNGERLAVIEAICLRIEEQMKAHAADDRAAFSAITERVGKLEKAWAKAATAGAIFGTGMTIYIKSLFSSMSK